MTLETLLMKKKQIFEIAKLYGATNVRVFGSVARGDANGTGDVDILVDLEPGRSLFDLGGLLMDLSELLGCKVHVVTEKSLKNHIRKRVLNEAIAI